MQSLRAVGRYRGFRGTWAANGQPLVDDARVILENPRFREAASRLFDTTEVAPNTVVVNVNAPMPAGAIHVDIASFRGATRDRYPIQLVQAMGSSGLFGPWRIIEAGAIVWFYDGPGGVYDYWPEGLGGAMRSERPPFTNRALVADNDRMYHRIGWIGDPAPTIPTITPGAQRGGLERKIIIHCVVRSLSRFVIADDRRERRHRHQRAVQILLDLL